MSKLALGTVQFGLDYGVSNTYGKTPVNEVREILQLALSNGIELLDTAYSYGDSESILGSAIEEDSGFQIITKTPLFNKQAISSNDVDDLITSFYNSLSKIRCKKVKGLLVHNADDLLVSGGDMIYSSVNKLKLDGLTDKIGVSVYSGRQIDMLLERYSFDIIQLPVNVFDQRLIRSGHLKKLKALGIEVHARSVFLQGLLLMNPDHLNNFFDPIKPVLNRFRALLSELKLSLTDGALGFVKSIQEIDFTIIGVNNITQLRTNLESFKKGYNDFFIDSIMQFSINDPKYLNPSKWSLQ